MKTPYASGQVNTDLNMQLQRQLEVRYMLQSLLVTDTQEKSPLSSFAAIINISLNESCVQSPNAIEIPLPEHSFKAWANQNVLNVISGDQDQPYRILNMKAQIVREFRQSQESFEIELNTLSPGPYLLQNGQNFQRFMIH